MIDARENAFVGSFVGQQPQVWFARLGQVRIRCCEISRIAVTVSPLHLGMQGRRSTRSSGLHTKVTQVRGHR